MKPGTDCVGCTLGLCEWVVPIDFKEIVARIVIGMDLMKPASENSGPGQRGATLLMPRVAAIKLPKSSPNWTIDVVVCLAWFAAAFRKKK